MSQLIGVDREGFERVIRVLWSSAETEGQWRGVGEDLVQWSSAGTAGQWRGVSEDLRAMRFLLAAADTVEGREAREDLRLLQDVAYRRYIGAIQ